MKLLYSLAGRLLFSRTIEKGGQAVKLMIKKKNSS